MHHVRAGGGRRSCEANRAGVEGQSFRDVGRGELGFHTAGVITVSPHEEDQQGDKEQEGGEMEDEKMFKKVFGESIEEALREVSEEGVGRERGKSRRPRTSRKWRSTTWTTLFSGAGVHIA